MQIQQRWRERAGGILYISSRSVRPSEQLPLEYPPTTSSPSPNTMVSEEIETAHGLDERTDAQCQMCRQSLVPKKILSGTGALPLWLMEF